MAITKFNNIQHRLRNPLPSRCHPPAAALATYNRLNAKPPPAKAAAPAPAAKPAAKKPATSAKRK